MQGHAKPVARRTRAAAISEIGLLGGSAALAIGGIGLVSAAFARQRRPEQEPDPAPQPSGEPELPDEPMGVPADEASKNGDVELPGFPRNDPTHG